MAKDTRIPIRLPSALKEEFEWAAARDGCTRGVSTWLRQLGEERAEELRLADRPPMTPGGAHSGAEGPQRAPGRAR
jgi:hypothetical protein